MKRTFQGFLFQDICGSTGTNTLPGPMISSLGQTRRWLHMPLIPALEPEAGRFLEFEVSLVYRASSRPPGATQRNPAFETKKQEALWAHTVMKRDGRRLLGRALCIRASGSPEVTLSKHELFLPFSVVLKGFLVLLKCLPTTL